jgi:hypothetical protein
MLQTQLDSLLLEETTQLDSPLLEETPQLVKDPMVANLNQVRVLPPNHLVLHSKDRLKEDLPQEDKTMVKEDLTMVKEDLTMVKALPQEDLPMVKEDLTMVKALPQEDLTMVKVLPQEDLLKVMTQEGNLFQQQRLLQQEVQP